MTPNTGAAAFPQCKAQPPPWRGHHQWKTVITNWWVLFLFGDPTIPYVATKGTGIETNDNDDYMYDAPSLDVIQACRRCLGLKRTLMDDNVGIGTIISEDS